MPKQEINKGFDFFNLPTVKKDKKSSLKSEEEKLSKETITEDVKKVELPAVEENTEFVVNKSKSKVKKAEQPKNIDEVQQIIELPKTDAVKITETTKIVKSNTEKNKNLVFKPIVNKTRKKRMQIYQKQKKKTVEKLMSEEFIKDPIFLSRLKKAPKEQTKDLILSQLDYYIFGDSIEKDDTEGRLNSKYKLFSKIRSLHHNDIPVMEHIDEVLHNLREYISYGLERNLSKKKGATKIFKSQEFGEIATAIALCIKMVKELPDNVWSNPHLKWLDACVGSGPFIMVVIKKLMNGLKNYKDSKLDLTDDKVRYKHIVEKMIYACEIQAKNMFIYRFLLDPKDNFILNTYHGDSLDFEKLGETMTNLWLTTQFDIILGNPPYNKENKKMPIIPINIGEEDTKAKQPQSHNLWSEFTLQFFKLLKPGGYLLYVTPESWKSPSSKVYKLFKTFNLKVVNFNVKEYFEGVGSTFSYFLLQNSKYENKTIVRGKTIKQDEGDDIVIPDIEIDIENLAYIPNGDSNSLSIHIKTIMNKTIDKFTTFCDTTSNHSSSKKINFSPEINDTHPYVVHHTNAQTLYSMIKSKNHDLKKVFFTISGYFNPIYDDGNTSTSEICLGILVNSEYEGKNLLKILKSKLFIFLIETAKWSGWLNKEILRSLPSLPLDKELNDDEIYQNFNLTTAEINCVEDYIKSKEVKDKLKIKK